MGERNCPFCGEPRCGCGVHPRGLGELGPRCEWCGEHVFGGKCTCVTADRNDHDQIPMPDHWREF